jgi:hypothetical protein
MIEIRTVPLDSVRINGGTQSRVELSQSTIAEYAEAIRFGTDLPPVAMFFDGAAFWLADGFHRYHAHRQAGAMEISAEIRIGTQRDAVLFSVGANASHGLRRTNEDKRRAVETLLADSEWKTWSQERIAKACQVSTGFVSKLVNQASLHGEEMKPAVRVVERNGTTYEQNTANIGKSKPEVVESDSIPPVAPPVEPAPSAARAPSLVAPSSLETLVTAESEQSGASDLAVEVETLREQVAELSEALKSTLADNDMMGRVFDADDRLKAAMDEAKRQKAIADNAERTLAAKSGEFIERARAVTYWKNRAEKAEKKLVNLEKSS